MKKVLIILMLFYGVSASAQLRDNNLNAIDVTAGYAENGFGANLSYNLYFSRSRRNNFLQLSAVVTFSEIEVEQFDLPYNLFAVNAGFFYNLPIDSRDKINFNVGGGLSGGIERLNDGKSELENGALLDSEGGFVYGPFVGGEFDFYLSENISFLVRGNGFYHINSDIGDFTIYAGAGLRFFL